jgi:polyhydroxyalkanoate synthase subunit PhaC
MNPLRALNALLERARPPVGRTPADVVIKENKWQLVRYRRRPEGVAYKTPLLLIPSLINRHYVLDLLPGRSFVEDMVRRGHDVYLIQWGTPGDEDRFVDFDTVCDRYVSRAIRATARTAASDRVHVLGYCLGGTIAAIHAAIRPERVASLIALAAPIGFIDDGLLSIWMRTKTFDVGEMIDACGNVPWPLMQASFHLLKPTLNLVKGVQLMDRLEDDEFLDQFMALEHWGSDNVSMYGEFYRTYAEQLYRRDALVRGELYVSGEHAALEKIRCPTLAVTFEHDHIVPPNSAAVLLDRISSTDKQRIHLSGGHVGAVVSRKAAATLWPQLSAWWAERDALDPSPEKTKPVKARPGRRAEA